MKRLYDSIVQNHLLAFQEMLFLSGPRQVGKTTVSKNTERLTSRFIYLNWDNEDHRQRILAGPSTIIETVNLHVLSDEKPIIAFDEIHKRPEWKNFIKGFFDTYGQEVRVLVTGSARLDVYKYGGDSLMGRYFSYRMHPFSVAECLRTNLAPSEISAPSEINTDDFDALFEFGGFPKPFLKRDRQFSVRWQNLRKQQLIQEDIRDVNMIHDLNRLQLLMDCLKERASQQITYSTLAKLIRVSVDTVIRWIDVLETFYYCYRIKPWSKNIVRSLIKEPKLFLWDWSLIKEPGARAENFIGSQLLKSVQNWTDRGFGEYDLYYIRTLEKKEVDFVVTKNGEAWFLVEVKLSDARHLSPHLEVFQKQTGALHAFQVVIDMPFVNQDCFAHTKPIIVPAKTFLSQLV
ncbi:MAG: ATP-binding protein [Gammaproteobacteria bacterium]|nr:ATP-binding protein [Gammaproteobacteria bacterium]